MKQHLEEHPVVDWSETIRRHFGKQKPVGGGEVTKLGQRAMWPQACNQIASSCAHQYKPFTYLFNPIRASNWVISLLATEDPLDLFVKK